MDLFQSFPNEEEGAIVHRQRVCIGEAFVVSALLLVISPCASAGSDNCWVDVFDRTDFGGNRARISGPAALSILTKVEGHDWSDRIESLAVGPQATVTAYRNENFRIDKEPGPAYHGEAIKAWGETAESYGNDAISFGPGKRQHHLGELEFHRNIRSLKVDCTP